MGIINEKYEQEKVDRLHEYLKQFGQNGAPIDYEIVVDGFKVVRRTNDPNLFNLYESFVSGNTKCVEILLFNGAARNYDKYIYRFGDMADTGLSGVPEKSVQKQVQEAIQKERDKIRVEQLEEENKGYHDEIEELEGQIEDLEKEIEDIKSKQSPLHGFLGEAGSAFVEGFIKRNPQILSNLPGGESLAGLLNEPKQLPTSNEPESTVTFTPKESVSESDKAAITFMNQVQERFTQEEFTKILALLESFAADKSQIEDVLNYLTKKTINNE
jgi:hypothetical protein